MDTSGHTSLCEDYVNFETAKLLKEKGFDWKCEYCYDVANDNPYSNANYQVSYPKPALSMAMKWLREVHNLHIDVDPSEGNWNPTVLELENWTCAVKFGDNIPIQDSYEEACEAGIRYCLENLI